MLCYVISCFLLNTTGSSIKATVNWPQRKYQHKAGPPASLTNVDYSTNKFHPNTEQKVWLKQQNSIKLESDCHLVALVWTAVNTWISVIVQPVGRRKYGRSSVTSPLKAWGLRSRLNASFVSQLPRPSTCSVIQCATYHVFTAPSLRCSAVVPKNGTGILQTVFFFS